MYKNDDRVNIKLNILRVRKQEKKKVKMHNHLKTAVYVNLNRSRYMLGIKPMPALDINVIIVDK